MIEKKILNCKSEIYFINRDINQKMFGVKVDYGSKFDDIFINSIYIPLGTAHFLEHMIFYKKNGHIGSNFINYGSYANAITSYDSTVFYATINHYFLEVIKLLTDVLLTPPELSEKNLNIEKRVVINEIKQKTNNILYKKYKSHLKKLYKNKSIVSDITGSENSLKTIGNTELSLAYFNFYKPSNLKFFVIGKFSIKEKEKIIDELNKKIKLCKYNYTKENIILNTERGILNYKDFNRNLKFKFLYNLGIFSFKDPINVLKYYKRDLYGKITIQFISKLIYDNYHDLDILESIFSIGSNYSLITILLYNKNKTTLDFSFLFKASMKESKKYIEEILEDIKQRLNMLYDSVDLYFLSFIEKANFNSTLDDYFYEIKNFDYNDFWKYFKSIVNIKQFLYKNTNMT